MRYRCIEQILHGTSDSDQRIYKAGEIVSLNDEDAAQLLQVGVIEPESVPMKLELNAGLFDQDKPASQKTDIQELFGKIHDSARAAVERVNELNASINELLVQREALERLTIPKADYMAIVRERIRDAGRVHEDLLKRREVQKLHRTIMANQRNSLGIDFLCAGAGAGNAPITYEGMCYFFEDLIVSGLEKAIFPPDYDEAGLTQSAAQIKEGIADIDHKVQRMTEERDEYAAVLKSYQLVQA
jgi:uncharacterized protein YhaN